MRISRNQFLEKAIWLTTVLLFSALYLFEYKSFGRYYLLGTSVIAFLLSLIQSNGRFKLHISLWHVFLLALAGYSFISSLWAIKPADAIQKSLTYMLVLACFSLVYICYQEGDKVFALIQVIKWSGFFVTIYAFAFYGFDNVVEMLNDEMRLSNKFANVNELGMLSAMAIVIQTYEITRVRKVPFSALLCIPSIVLVAATQSRKALILVVIGILLVLISQQAGNKNIVKSMLRVTAIVVAIGIVFFLLLQLPAFAGIRERTMSLVALVTQRGKVGSSTRMRSQMIALGWEYFLKNPVGGVGIGCPHILASWHLQFDSYLHNNYIELLAGGGVIGFCLYYGIYVCLFLNMYRYREYADEEYWLCIIMMILLLIMDVAAVSAYTKKNYIYFMIFFLEVKKLRKRSCNHATNEVDQKGKAISNR